MGARLDNISAVLGFPYSLFPPTDLSLNLSHIPYSPPPSEYLHHVSNLLHQLESIP